MLGMIPILLSFLLARVLLAMLGMIPILLSFSLVGNGPTQIAMRTWTVHG